MRIQPFRFEKELMRGLIGKLDDFVFNRGAISRADGLDLPAVHGRAMHIFPDNAVGFRRSPGDVTRHLLIMMCNSPGAKTKWRRVGITRLDLKLRPVDSSAIQSRWSSSLKPASAQAKLLQSFAEKHRSRLARASGRILLFATMNKAIEECAGGDDHGLSADRASITETDTQNSPWA